jgi:hypothetical protein
MTTTRAIHQPVCLVAVFVPAGAAQIDTPKTRSDAAHDRTDRHHVWLGLEPDPIKVRTDTRWIGELLLDDLERGDGPEHASEQREAGEGFL